MTWKVDQVLSDADNLAVVGVRRVDRLATAGVPIAIAVDVKNTGLDATQARRRASRRRHRATRTRIDDETAAQLRAIGYVVD